MGVDIDWSLLTNASQNFGNALTGAAQQVRQRRDASADREATANYLQNPNDPAAYKAAVQRNPTQALAIQEHHLEAVRNLRQDQQQQFDTIGQLLTAPNGQPIAEADYPAAVAAAQRMGIDVTGHETWDPTYVHTAVALHQRMHPDANVTLHSGDTLNNARTGTVVGQGNPTPDVVVPMQGGGYVVRHSNPDGSITITDQNGAIHYEHPAAASAPAPAATGGPPAISPSDTIIVNPQTRQQMRLNPQTNQWEPLAAGGQPQAGAGNFQ